jgi:hypothetical protein
MESNHFLIVQPNLPNHQDILEELKAQLERCQALVAEINQIPGAKARVQMVWSLPVEVEKLQNGRKTE